MGRHARGAMKKLQAYRATIMLAVAATLGAPSVDAQQILEIDTTAGRVIIDDEWRAIRTVDSCCLSPAWIQPPQSPTPRARRHSSRYATRGAAGFTRSTRWGATLAAGARHPILIPY